MADYRAYIIGSDGLFHSSVYIESDDDLAAIQVAETLVDGHDVELWQLDRRVMILFHQTQKQDNSQ